MIPLTDIIQPGSPLFVPITGFLPGPGAWLQGIIMIAVSGLLLPILLPLPGIAAFAGVPVIFTFCFLLKEQVNPYDVSRIDSLTRVWRCPNNPEAGLM